MSTTKTEAVSSLTLLAAGPSLSSHAARAHAMKNCLAVVIACRRLLERDVPERSRARLARMDEAARRMSELLAEELRYGATETTTSTLSSVSEIVDMAVARVSDQADAGGVRLLVQCGGGHLVAQRSDLVEALLNVVSNAVQATPAGGVVTVTTFMTSEGDQEWVIQDTGCGMGKDVLAKVGRPLASHRDGGSGLGLALARELVGRHDGLLRIESARGAGTTVMIWLPHDRTQL